MIDFRNDPLLSVLSILAILVVVWVGATFIVLPPTVISCINAGFADAIGLSPWHMFCTRTYDATEYVCPVAKLQECEVPWK